MKIPHHLGIILDGNRRWAKERNLPFFDGHRKGLEQVKKIITHCQKRGIKELTLFVFSSENWNRDEKEVSFLMNLAKEFLINGLNKYKNQGAKIKLIGQKERLPRELQEKISQIENETKDNKGIQINLALSYGGRAEILEAIKKIIKLKIDPDKITEETIRENLWTSDVDLIIRTGKEQRLSNFLLWQAAYSEFYFCEKMWPDFTEEDLDKALLNYSKRQRRFGR